MSFYDPSKIKLLDPSEREIKRLYWRDDMENYGILKWFAHTVGTVVGYSNVDIPAFEGDYVLESQHAALFPFEVRMTRFGCFEAQKTAFEIRWWHETEIQFTSISQLRYPNVGGGRRAIIRWIRTRIDGTSGWQYMNQNGAYADIPGAREALIDETWNYLYIVVDWKKNRYDRLKTNLLDLDLTSLLQNPTLSALPGAGGMFEVILGFHIVPPGPLPHPCYVDDARIYLNEE